MKIKDRIIKVEKIEWQKAKWFQPVEFKKSSKEQIEKLKQSIKNNGFADAFDVWQKNSTLYILDGCRRDLALRELAKEGVEIPDKLSAVFYNIKNEAEAKKIIMLRQSQYGKIDEDFTLDWLKDDFDLGELSLELELPSFDLKEPVEIIEDEPPPVPNKAKSKLGDLYELGEHQILCGDCTDEKQVERLMNGRMADMILNDPPYGIGKNIENDNLKREKKIAFYETFTRNMLSVLKENGYLYVWGYFDTLSDYWQEVLKPRGDCNFRNFIIWQKSYVQGINSLDFRQFPENYEACLLCIFGQPFQNGPWSTTPNSEHYWEGFEPIRSYLDAERKKMGWDIQTIKKIVGHSDPNRDHWFSKSQWSFPTRQVYEDLQSASKYNAFQKEYDELRKEYDELRGHFDNSFGFTDIWEPNKLTTTNKHPTVKPIEVCERAIVSTSKKHEVVLDLFLGSGSTLIACQQTSRICYGMEIEPLYIDVTIQRWVNFTGIENIKKNGKEIVWKAESVKC